MEPKLKKVLELFTQPVFLAQDGSIVWCNGAARSLLSEGMPVSALLENEDALLSLWTREGTLQIPLIIGGAEYAASVLATPEGDLFVASRRKQEWNATAAAMESASASLRRPLHEMLNAADALFEQLEASQADTPPAASELNRSLYRLLRLCGQMSDGAQLLLHRKQVHREPTELIGFLREFVCNAGPLAESAGVTLTFTPSVQSLRGDVDRALLERALYNLLSNALTYTPQGGTVTLSVQKQERLLLLRMRDTGEGVGEGVMATLFERFSSPTPGDPRRGIGLGLPLVREIARLHGGTLSIEAMPEGGTCVTLSISLEHAVFQLHSRVVCYDSYGDFNHALVELSDVLDAKLFDPTEIQ